MKNKHIFIPLFVFLGAGLVSLTASIIDFKAVNKQLSYSSATIQFNYDGASDGYDPNGRSFDAVSFMTDDVVESALNKTGLTGEKYEVENVKQYIAIENVVPKNIVKEINSYESILGGKGTSTISSNDYHPVRYRFVVYQDLGVSQSKLNELAKNLVDEYSNKFYQVYLNNLDTALLNELLNFDGYDYRYQTSLLAREVRTIVNYSNELYARHDDFEVEGVSFKDLTEKANQILENINTIDEVIVLRSISKLPETIKDYYNYRIDNLTIEKTKYQTDLDAVTDQFNNYQKDKTSYVGNGETIVEIGNNSEETYNTLLAKKLSLENKVAELTSEINRYEELKTRVDSVTPAEVSSVETRISSAKAKYEELDDNFTELLAGYNQKYLSETAVTKSKVEYKSSSLISSAFVINTIKIAAPIMITVMLGIAIYYLVRVIKKEKVTK